MAKKQTFGEEAMRKKAAHRRMAKVIISTKTDKNNYAFKEAIIDQESVRDYINENKS